MSTNVSDTYSATPRTVALGKISSSWLKLVNMKCTLFADVSILACVGCDVSRAVSRATVSTLESVRVVCIP